MKYSLDKMGEGMIYVFKTQERKSYAIALYITE